MRYLRRQADYLRCDSRFTGNWSGRRSGKTWIARRRFVKRVLRDMFRLSGEDLWYLVGAPTHAQARRLFWRPLNMLFPEEAVADRRVSPIPTIELVNGAQIMITGLDAPERFEGLPLRGALIDEYGNCKPTVWEENLRPALIDLTGWADFVGVPEGRNHWWELVQMILEGEDPEWSGFHWHTMDVLPIYLGEEQAQREIDACARQMDELTFNQELKGEFVSFTGRAYHAFDSTVHSAVALEYDPERPLILTFDFNVAPGTANALQEKEWGTCVLDEFHIARDSTTPRICKLIEARYGTHGGDVLAYGDATGGAKGSAKVRGSDVDLIRDSLRPVFGHRLKMRFPKSNPRERVRLNAVNSRFLSRSGEARLFVDPRCKFTVRDFDGVRLKEDGSGEIDKSDSELTHHSDGIGYYVVKKHPLRIGGAKVETYA